MGKGKLQKFAEMRTLSNVYECPARDIEEKDFRRLPLLKQEQFAGKWHTVFGNSNPIVLELGCGKGEYTVGLARRYPEKNFIGVDIKGARMWTGAKQANEQGINNAAFLRTNIEMITQFFCEDEVSEIWLTFSDPQMKKPTKRLTHSGFLDRYRLILREDGLIHLKTDSRFLYTYTLELLRANSIVPLVATDDLYGTLAAGNETSAGSRQLPDLDIRTYYEQMWLDRGLTIKYLRFSLPRGKALIEPDVEIEPDEYRSYGREKK